MKVGFVLLSPQSSPVPSTRVAVLNMLPYLRADGFDPVVLFEPAVATQTPAIHLQAERIAHDGYRVVCFQKVGGPQVLELVRSLRQRGVKTVFIVCDVVDPVMVQATDVTIVVTQFLKQQHPTPLLHKIHVVHDGIERPDVVKTAWRDDRGSSRRPLHAVLVTSAPMERLPVMGPPPPWLRVTVVGRYAANENAWQRCRELQYRVRQQTNWRHRFDALTFRLHSGIDCVPWHTEGVYEQLRAADIGILPIDSSPGMVPGGAAPSWSVKSENRLTLKMAVGLPVVATPIPAYEPALRSGSDGFFASTRVEWQQHLEQLRDPGLRREMGADARGAVIDRYSMAVQARLLGAILRGASN